MMKLSLRCVLALLSVSLSVALLREHRPVYAQSCGGGGGGTGGGGCPNYCPSPVPSCPHPDCDQGENCDFYWVCDSPIVVDVRKEGFHLTSEADGVQFTFSSGTKKQVAWTDPHFGNAWLALDRNGNGTIDDATELFGNFTPQPPLPSPNGFVALAVYDSPENGGNADGVISAADSIYPHLLLWTDLNHNGISEPNELQTLAQAGVTSIALNYQNSHKKDQYGNLFRYAGHVSMDAVHYDHLIYDVYLVGAN